MMKNSYACYDRLEFHVKNDVTLMEFVYADGKRDVSYPFEKQPIRCTYDEEGIEHIEKAGEIQKTVRYTPGKPGEMLVLTYAGDTVTDRFSINIVPSENHGYIKVSERDRRYFEYTDGTPYVPVGINMVYPTAYTVSDGTEFGRSLQTGFIGLQQYRGWFQKLKENHANLARIWVGHPYFTPDTENAYQLDLTQFSKIDSIVDMAREYGIKLKMTVEQFRFFDYNEAPDRNGYSGYIQSLFGKQLWVNGIRCDSISKWLSDRECIKAWKYKIAEFAKRYAGDTNLFAIEFWNEMSAVRADSYSDVLKWNEMMLPIVKELFPNTLVINSLGSFDYENAKKAYRDFPWKLFDFKQLHRYLDQGAPYEICRESPIALIQDGMALLKTAEQPLIVAETGAVEKRHSGPFKYYSADDDGLIFADCVYTPFFCESAGCGNIWHWDNRYVESKSLFKMFQPFAKLLEGIDAPAEDFHAVDLSDDAAYILVLEGKNCILGYIRNKTSNWMNVLRDLNQVEEIRELPIHVGKMKEFRMIKIWEDNTTAEKAEDTILFRNVRHGVMFQVRR